MGDGEFERLPNRAMQVRGACAADAGGDSARMDARLEEHFVGIDVAETPEESLIQQKRFDTRVPAAQSFDEVEQRDAERIGTECGDTRGQGIGILDAAELSGVVVEQSAVVEVKDSVGVSRARGIDEEFSRHAEMNDEDAEVEFDDDEFAVAADVTDGAVGELEREGVAVAGGDESGVEFGGLDDAAGEVRRE